MKGFVLAPSQLQELRAAHRSALKNKDGRAAYKLNAVILLGTGWSIEEVVEALLLDNETLRKYIRDYRNGGLSELMQTHYKGGIPKLSDDQIQKLCAELDENIYPTTQAIVEYIQKEFRVVYTLSGLTDLLHRLDYSYKKPKIVPGNPDPVAQEMFLKQFLNFMEKKQENEAVFFMDAVHPTHNAEPSYGWFRKGKTTELKSNSGRSRLNIHGAMNAETYETTIIASKENINAESTIQLFAYLETLHPLATTIYIVLDNAKYHFSDTVREWLKKSKIKLAFIPAYSPELNLIERLWRIFKKHVTKNKYYATFQEFEKACVRFFEKQNNYRDEIELIMGDGLEALV